MVDYFVDLVPDTFGPVLFKPGTVYHKLLYNRTHCSKTHPTTMYKIDQALVEPILFTNKVVGGQVEGHAIAHLRKSNKATNQ